jgi:exoribonuclease-2
VGIDHTSPNPSLSSEWSIRPQTAGVLHGTSSVGVQSGPGAVPLHFHDGRWNLSGLAEHALQAHGLSTSFPGAVIHEAAAITGPAPFNPNIVDLRKKPWSSIDNGGKSKDGKDIVTSKDLDQIEFSERLPDGSIKIYVAIADVDALVPKGSEIDQHAIGNLDQIVASAPRSDLQKKDKNRKVAPGNNFSIYTPTTVFPMLPEELSTDYTSLNEGQDRQAMVIEYTVAPDGSMQDENVYPAMVRSHSAMAYPGIGAWLDPDGDGKITQKRGRVPDYLAAAPPEIAEQVEMQAEAAQRLKRHRADAGSLTFADMQTQARVDSHGNVTSVELHQASVSSELIENLMAAANGVVSRTLRAKGFPTLQRVVKDPEKWNKIRDFVKIQGGELPDKPDSKALQVFLNASREKAIFPEISSEIVRLIGKGEYIALASGDTPEGHFALSVDDYSHFTAPNRRGPDLITSRLLKAALAGEKCPYTLEQLRALAQHFCDREHSIKKAERQVEKQAAGVFLLEHNMLHQKFDAYVTGQNDFGTFVRIDNPRAEGFCKGAMSAKFGDQLKVELTGVNVQAGWIDFATVGGINQGEGNHD